jgi:hypothetical protein
MLSVDLEWRGRPVAIDPGTYSYNTKGKFAGALAEAAVHNTITFAGTEPMERIGRFLFLPWPEGEAGFVNDGNGFTARHSGWNRIGVSHYRTILRLGNNGFVVKDEIFCRNPCSARVHWLFQDWPFELEAADARLVLRTDAGKVAMSWTGAPEGIVTLVRADPASARGWQAPHYHQAVPALSLAIDIRLCGRLSLETRFQPIGAD